MDEKRSIEILIDMFKDLDRLGPGSTASTQKALSMLPPLQATHRILDVGCGRGAQTRTLWQHTVATIDAVDLFPEFTDAVNAAAARDGVSDRVRAAKGDMFRLDFPSASFDVAWSEGAIYIMGFEAGLNAWRPLLKPGGHIAVSEVAWIREGVPAACREFWASEYPQITGVDENLATLERCGFDLVDHFTLPPSDWADAYYAPLAEKLPAFRAKYAGDVDALEVIDQFEQEIGFFDAYGSFYGYEFFIARSSH